MPGNATNYPDVAFFRAVDNSPAFPQVPVSTTMDLGLSSLR